MKTRIFYYEIKIGSITKKVIDCTIKKACRGFELMNKFPSCRYCHQILLPNHEKKGWCPVCGMEIDEIKNSINEIINYDENTGWKT